MINIHKVGFPFLRLCVFVRLNKHFRISESLDWRQQAEQVQAEQVQAYFFSRAVNNASEVSEVTMTWWLVKVKVCCALPVHMAHIVSHLLRLLPTRF